VKLPAHSNRLLPVELSRCKEEPLISKKPDLVETFPVASVFIMHSRSFRRMNRRLLSVSLLFASFGFSGPLFAQADAPAAVPVPVAELSLEECVARALEKNFDLEIQRITTGQAKENVIVAESEFDPSLDVTANRKFLQQPAAVSSVDGVTSVGLRNEGDGIRGGVSKKISSGAVLSASTALDRSKSNSRNLFLNPAYNGDLSFAIRQPLLKGAGSEVNRAAIRRAQIGVDRANFDLKGSVLDVVRNVEAAYYNLVFARGQRTVRDLSLQLAQQLLEENRIRRQTGVATELDVLQSEVGVANARRNVLLAQQTVNDREDALQVLIGQFEFDRPLGTVGFQAYDVPSVNFENSYQLARANEPDLASLDASVRQLEIDARSAKHNQLPTLDVGGAVGFGSRENSYENAATRVWDGDGYDWQVDVALRFPWGLREEKARYRLAQTSVTREQTRYRQIDQNLMADVRGAVRSLDTNRESVTISALATELSKRQYDLERERLNAGLSTSRRVLEAQDDLETARVNDLQAKVTLRIALAELQRLEGTSLSRFKITVAEIR